MVCSTCRGQCLGDNVSGTGMCALYMSSTWYMEGGDGDLTGEDEIA